MIMSENNKYYEENKMLREEVCRQRVALNECRRELNTIADKYVNKGKDNCHLIAENAILKSIIEDIPKASHRLKQIDLNGSVENICQDIDGYNRLCKRG